MKVCSLPPPRPARHSSGRGPFIVLSLFGNGTRTARTVSLLALHTPLARCDRASHATCSPRPRSTGGYYHGKLLFPDGYPFKPPGIMMLTPSGRFQTATR